MIAAGEQFLIPSYKNKHNQEGNHVGNDHTDRVKLPGKPFKGQPPETKHQEVNKPHLQKGDPNPGKDIGQSTAIQLESQAFKRPFIQPAPRDIDGAGNNQEVQDLPPDGTNIQDAKEGGNPAENESEDKQQ